MNKIIIAVLLGLFLAFGALAAEQPIENPNQMQVQPGIPNQQTGVPGQIPTQMGTPGRIQTQPGIPGKMQGQPGAAGTQAQPVMAPKNPYPLPVLLKAILEMQKKAALALNSKQKMEIRQVLIKAQGCDIDIESLRIRMKKVLNSKQMNYINDLKKKGKLTYMPTGTPKAGKNPIVAEVLSLLAQKAGIKEKTATPAATSATKPSAAPAPAAGK